MKILPVIGKIGPLANGINNIAGPTLS